MQKLAGFKNSGCAAISATKKYENIYSAKNEPDMKIIPALMSILFFSGSVYAANCSSVVEMEAADTAVRSINNWAGVNSFFHKFKQCDDGYIAEGLSSSVSKLLADSWSTTGQLEKMTASDRAFESWVLNHINTTSDDKDLELILNNARGNCLENNKNFCKKIESAANQALQELKE